VGPQGRFKKQYNLSAWSFNFDGATSSVFIIMESCHLVNALIETFTKTKKELDSFDTVDQLMNFYNMVYIIFISRVVSSIYRYFIQQDRIKENCSAETVADFICCLEKSYYVALGNNKISIESKRM